MQPTITPEKIEEIKNCCIEKGYCIDFVERFITFRKTNDDWHGNFPGNYAGIKILAEIKCIRSIKCVKSKLISTGNYRVYVCGNDDYYLVKLFTSKDLALSFVNNLPYCIGQKQLKRLGFCVE